MDLILVETKSNILKPQIMFQLSQQIKKKINKNLMKIKLKNFAHSCEIILK